MNADNLSQEHLTTQAVHQRRPLDPHEQRLLDKLEATIERGFKTFIEVGVALKRIRDSRLYLASHHTFEEYCQGRWKMMASRARHLISASTIAKKIATVTAVTPIAEWQVRPLMGVPEERRAEVWEQPVKLNENAVPSAQKVEQAARVVLAPRKSAPIEETTQESKGVVLAHEAINSLNRIPRNDPLRKRRFELVADHIASKAKVSTCRTKIEQEIMGLTEEARAMLRRPSAQISIMELRRTVEGLLGKLSCRFPE